MAGPESSSASEYTAGTMAIGLTLPSSEVIVFFRTGSFAALRR